MSMIKLVGCKLVSNLALRPAIVGQMNAVNGYFWGKDKKFAHPLEHATGEEKMLALAELHGIDDPYDTKIHKRNPESLSKNKPNIVPCFEDKRMIACLCEDDATSLNYLWVHMDEPKRCACGYWFKLVPAKKFWEDIGYCPPYLKE